jgi:hypothetical protein
MLSGFATFDILFLSTIIITVVLTGWAIWKFSNQTIVGGTLIIAAAPSGQITPHHSTIHVVSPYQAPVAPAAEVPKMDPLDPKNPYNVLPTYTEATSNNYNDQMHSMMAKSPVHS